MGNSLEPKKPSPQPQSQVQTILKAPIKVTPSLMPKKPFLHRATLHSCLKVNKQSYKGNLRIFDNNIVIKNHLETQELEKFWNESRRRVKVHQWRGVTRVAVNCSRSFGFTDKEMDTIKIGIVCCFPKMRHLKINFNDCFYIKGKTISSISSSIANKMTDLQQFSVNFASAKLFEDKYLSEIAKNAIKKLDLKTFGFGLTKSQRVTDFALQRFLKNVSRYFRRIENLALNFEGCSLTAKSLEGIETTLAKTTRLKDLNLTFFDHNSTSKFYLGTILSSLKSLKNLSRLGLDFKNSNRLLCQDFHKLGEIIGQSLPQLTQLEFILGNCESLSDSDYEEFVTNSIVKLKSLTHLTLGFHGCSFFSDHGLQPVVSLIATQCTDLECLQIFLTESLYITDYGLSYLLSEVSTHLIKLKSLSLSFTNCPAITLEELSFVPGADNQAQSNLIFPISSQTEQKTNELRENIIRNNLRNLKQFTIYFAKCENIRDEGLAKLGSQIGRYLTNLQDLSISLFLTQDLTDKSFDGFRESTIRNLPKLQQLKIHFMSVSITGCIPSKGVSDEAIKKLGDDLENYLSELQILRFYLLSNRDKSHLLRMELLKQLEFIDDLEILC